VRTGAGGRLSPALSIYSGAYGRAPAASVLIGKIVQKTIEILEVNPPKTGVGKTGKPYSIVECECLVVAGDGTRKVGVLTLGQKIDASKVVPGLYVGTFDVSVNYKDRKIGAEIVDLVPTPVAKPSASRAPSPSAP
jgi:hypothetical protein